MQKEELLHLHMLLVHIKRYYENLIGEEIATNGYDSIHISPIHIHKNKICHKKAILTLSDEIVTHIKAHQHPVIEYSTEIKSKGIAAEY